MRPVVIIGDLHLRDDFDGYIDAQLDTVIGITEDAAKILKCSFNIAFLGDVFDKRNPKVTELLAFNDFLGKLVWKQYIGEILVLRGNHDTLDKHSVRTSLSLLKNICLISIPFPVDGMYCIPHYEENEEIKKALKLAELSGSRLVLGHFGYRGCITPEGEAESGDIALDDFKVTTVLGHIHTPKEEGNVTVLGTPYSTSFSESWKNHRFAIFKGGKLSTHPVRTKVNHINMMDSDLENLSDFKTEKDAYNLVTFYATRETDQKAVRAKLRKFAKFVMIKYKDIVNDFSQHWIGSIEDLPSYAKECKTGLNIEKLEETAKDLIKELNENSEDNS